MKIFVQEESGDHNLEVNEPAITKLNEAVAAWWHQGGYYTTGDDGKEIFIPFHRIIHIKEL